MDYQQALRHFAIALEKQPKNTSILEGIGYVKRRQGKLEEAVENLKLASELDPRSNAIAFSLSETYALLRNYQEAEKGYNRALFLRPDHEYAWAFKTRLFINQGDIKKARQVLEEASQTLGLVEANLLLYHWSWLIFLRGNTKRQSKGLPPSHWTLFQTNFILSRKLILLLKFMGL